jgi:hypothetical protein
MSKKLHTCSLFLCIFAMKLSVFIESTQDKQVFTEAF